MRVTNYTRSVADGWVRISATVEWEDVERARKSIYLETEERFEASFDANAHTFLLATVLIAMQNGERRLQIDGSVCPKLRNGIDTAIQQLRQWYGNESHQPVRIEPTRGFSPLPAAHGRHTASLMSGGVDALATLRANRLDFPAAHEYAIRDCFFVHGIDVGGYESLPHNRENFEQTIGSLARLAHDSGFTLIPVSTNMRFLEKEDDFFAKESHAACLSAVAHAFSRRVSRLLIPSSYAIDELFPWGSHPVLDPNYSSADLAIEHDAVRLTRMEKVALIAAWPEALRTLRSCWDAFRPASDLNCGRCEKCIRTMTQLLVRGKLAGCPSFPHDDVSADLLRTLRTRPPQHVPRDRRALLETCAYVSLTPGSAHFWRPLVDPLRAMDRDDLADVIEEKLAEVKEAHKPGWRAFARRIDESLLGGRLRRGYRYRGRTNSGYSQ